jgi:hypothetical protein
VKIETLMSAEALVDASCGGTASAPGTTRTRSRSRPSTNTSTSTRTRTTSDTSSSTSTSSSTYISRKYGSAIAGLDSAENLDAERVGGLAGAYDAERAGGLAGAGPADLWNGMIYPLLNIRFTGVIFYQGESNSLAGAPNAYACLFPALIADWRRKFTLPDMGFFFVQLAAYGWHDYTHTRLAQLAALKLPNVGMATAIDLGDMQSPNGGIHPRLKQEVGRRLALTVRAVQYLEPGVVFHGHGARFRQDFALNDAIGSHVFSFVALACVRSNGMPLGRSLLPIN